MTARWYTLRPIDQWPGKMTQSRSTSRFEDWLRLQRVREVLGL